MGMCSIGTCIGMHIHMCMAAHTDEKPAARFHLLSDGPSGHMPIHMSIRMPIRMSMHASIRMSIHNTHVAAYVFAHVDTPGSALVCNIHRYAAWDKTGSAYDEMQGCHYVASMRDKWSQAHKRVPSNVLSNGLPNVLSNGVPSVRSNSRSDIPSNALLNVLEDIRSNVRLNV